MAAMPRSWAVMGSVMTTFSPFSMISPPSGWCTPVSVLMNVDFPAPFSPTIACISPAFRLKCTLSSALTPGKILVIPFISSMYSEPGIFPPPFRSGL